MREAEAEQNPLISLDMDSNNLNDGGNFPGGASGGGGGGMNIPQQPFSYPNKVCTIMEESSAPFLLGVEPI